MSGREWRASISLASIFGLRMIGLFLILPVFAVHARTLPGGDDPTLIGLALGIYGLTQGCLQIPFGVASDRFGRKPVIIAGLVVFAIGSVVAALATDLWSTIIGRAIQGAGAVSAAVTAMIADSTRDEHRTKAMALVGATIGATFALSMVLAPALYARVGLDGMFWLTAALSAAAIGVVLWVVPAVPIHHDAQAERPPWPRVVLDPELLRLNVGIFVLHAVQMAMFVVVPVMLVALGLPLARHWSVYLPAVLLSFVLMVPPIVYGERRGRMRAVFLASIAALAVIEAGLGGWAPSLAWITFWLIAFFVAFNVLESALPSMVSRLAPPSAKGLALGVYNTTQALGLFVGGLLGGWLARHAGAAGVFGFAVAAMLLWLAIAWGMRELPRRGSARPLETSAAVGSALD